VLTVGQPAFKRTVKIRIEMSAGVWKRRIQWAETFFQWRCSLGFHFAACFDAQMVCCALKADALNLISTGCYESMEMTWFWRHDQQMFKQSLMTMTSWLEAQAVIAKTDGRVVSIRKGVD
jgi:hypothetical protein